MRTSADAYLAQVNRSNRVRNEFRHTQRLLSLLVVLCVFWGLKLTGITMAGEAFCGMEEHIHSEECAVRELICELEEAEPHVHTDSCLHRQLCCELPEQEGHVHGADCVERLLTCTLEETAGHTHGDSCYTVMEGYVCGKEETQEHFHTDGCYGSEEGNYICGKEETEGHTHGEACYQIQECSLEEHIHDVTCYSDISADLETSDDWETPFEELTPSENLIENIIMVARSQIGVTESTRNFQVDELGIRRGITRYGQWYGNPYGDWSAMFVSFCLEYADVEDLPRNAGVEAMRLEWEEEQLYVSAEEQLPAPGQLVFLDKDEDGEADSVAIITDHILGEENENVIFTVEGDLQEAITQIGTVFLYPEEESEAAFVEMAAPEDAASAEEVTAADMVAETLYSVDDPAILGYGLVPEHAPDKIMMMNPAPRADEMTYLGRTINYSNNMFTNGRSFVVYAQHNGEYYAFVSNPASGMENTVAAVPIQIDENGNIYAEGVSADNLLWNFTRDGNSGSNYFIQNVATNRYLHPGGDYAVIYEGKWPTALSADGNGAKLRHTGSNDVAIAFDSAEKIFKNVTQNQATTLYFGISEMCTIWLDGTDGGLRVLGGAEERKETAAIGSAYTLPDEFGSPEKYLYKIRGWYEVTTHTYYQPGDTVTVTDNLVFYADWVPATYDIGQFNEHVTNTVSTNGYITTRLYDYNYLFNIQSSNANVTASSSSHSETWSMVSSGNVQYDNQNTFNFIFGENDSGGKLSNPNNRSDDNRYHDAHTVSDGIYNAELGELLFGTDNDFNPETGEGIIGKTYLGTGDHLLKLIDDPNDPHYGYYGYDSKRNAASFNQSKGRFYVYDYLAATSDSIGGAYSDFLPLNSPYIAPEGKNVGTYTYDGVDGEYRGVTHYRYDSAYNSGDHNSVNNVYTDYAYGMRMDVNFFLPNDPGTGGNKDLYGNDIVFEFSGDDDLWVLIDGVVALDIGGIHQSVPGTINFSTGEVRVNNAAKTSLMNLGIEAGDHVMTVLYLERGSSMSNCSIYFNLMPRYALEIKKEDVLTQKILDGTQFTVYEDLKCTKPAELWVSEEAYKRDLAEDGIANAFQSTFTVTDGVAKIWGLGSGNTYYIKETGAPKVDGYGLATGLIRLALSKDGQATYNAEVIPDADGNEPSNGFTIHGIRIDETTKTVYLTATNAPESVIETTTVQVMKKWEDTVDHSDDYIEAYLTVTDSDGTIRRIREVVLSDENDWEYMWTNLPKYNYDQLTEVKYGIEESYESGYYSTVRRITQIELSHSYWAEATSFINGEAYILSTSRGYLSTTSATNANLTWVNEATAKSSPLATWTATVSSGKVKFTNGSQQILSFNNGNTNNNRYFYATTGNTNYQSFTPEDTETGFRFYATRNNNNTKYYISNNNISNGRISSVTSSGTALILTPMELVTETETQDVQNWGYQITNTPLEEGNETSLTVQKDWIVPEGFDETLYEESAVTISLMANGVSTGRTVTLTLKNGWSGIFQGLPYKDENGNVIQYAVKEEWKKQYWSVTYGPIVTSDGETPTYSTTLTNAYYRGGPMLPSTGTAARMLYVLCGGGMMLSSLVYGIVLRRKRERRMK